MPQTSSGAVWKEYAGERLCDSQSQARGDAEEQDAHVWSRAAPTSVILMPSWVESSWEEERAYKTGSVIDGPPKSKASALPVSADSQRQERENSKSLEIEPVAQRRPHGLIAFETQQLTGGQRRHTRQCFL